MVATFAPVFATFPELYSTGFRSRMCKGLYLGFNVIAVCIL
jgi:hypothetical protein